MIEITACYSFARLNSLSIRSPSSRCPKPDAQSPMPLSPNPQCTTSCRYEGSKSIISRHTMLKCALHFTWDVKRRSRLTGLFQRNRWVLPEGPVRLWPSCSTRLLMREYPAEAERKPSFRSETDVLRDIQPRCAPVLGPPVRSQSILSWSELRRI